jgi:ferredoxin
VLLGAPDSLALDRLGCRLLGVPEIEVAHIRYARQENPSAVYRVIGDEPPLAQTAVKPGAIKERAHQALIHAAYLADVPYAALTGQSLLPRLHFELGVKPFLVASKCTECGACAPICPAAAIDLPGKRIIRERCEKLRCLRCIPVCPTQAIEVRGWRRPKR